MISEQTLDWPRTAPLLASGILRATPEDFVVTEVLTIPLSGSGEHVWLKVRKRGWNTDRVAQQLARAAGVPRRDVSYAGLKDRHAVSTQWFSVQLPGRDAPPWTDMLPPEIEILESARHGRKLQPGALAGNSFDIVLRECSGDREGLVRRAQDISVRGVPNYFGEQRFGHNGANVERALAMFGGKFNTRDRHLRGIYLSAARAFLFNQVLAQRVRQATWDQGLEGEVFVLHGSHSFFAAASIDDTLIARLKNGDIHTSGPLWGRGVALTCNCARALEDEIVARYSSIAQGLEAAGLRQERRALRLLPQELTLQWLDVPTAQPDPPWPASLASIPSAKAQPGHPWPAPLASIPSAKAGRGGGPSGTSAEQSAVRITFRLPAGCYATTLLRELLDYRSAGPMVDGG